jgi:Rap1a immunity proteins
MGSCIGQIQMLYSLGFGQQLAANAKFCPPDGVTIDQTRKVVVKYIDDRPEQLQQPFFLLAIDALRGWLPRASAHFRRPVDAIMLMSQ